MEAWGAAIPLPGDADSDAIRTAVKSVLADAAYKTAAGDLAKLVKPLDGSTGAADELMAFAAGRATKVSAAE